MLIHELQGTKTLIEEQDQVFIKKYWLSPVPTNLEVKLLLDLFPKYNAKRIFLGFMLVTGARPIEITRLNWNSFEFDKIKQKFNYLYHYAYKPTNRVVKTGNHKYFKQLKKEIYNKSKWFNELLLEYQNHSPIYESNRLFGFTSTDAVQKTFKELRKRISSDPKYYFLKEEINVSAENNIGGSRYRVTLYSLRKFAITFLYWSKKPIGYDQDIISLSKYIGHSDVKTTLNHYVYPKESIGLTEEMIDKKITLDEFIFSSNPEKKQKTLNEYTIIKPKYIFIEKNQKTLNEYYI